MVGLHNNLDIPVYKGTLQYKIWPLKTMDVNCAYYYCASISNRYSYKHTHNLHSWEYWTLWRHEVCESNGSHWSNKGYNMEKYMLLKV